VRIKPQYAENLAIRLIFTVYQQIWHKCCKPIVTTSTSTTKLNLLKQKTATNPNLLLYSPYYAEACNESYYTEACNESYYAKTINESYYVEACNESYYAKTIIESYYVEACNESYYREACNELAMPIAST